jgi:predicted PurR-regulated permease PerM
MTEEVNSKTLEKSEGQTPGTLKNRIGITKKRRQIVSFGSIKMWWAVLGVYLLIFGYVGYIAFWPMAFNDPDNTVKKYLAILEEYQAKNKTDEEPANLKLVMEELMKKAEESAQDMQQLASQSFNIVLGAFLAFLSATVTTIFQGARGQNKEPEPDETGIETKESEHV